MRIIKNQDILQRQSDNYVRGELSNIASVVQTNMILTEYFQIDPDFTTTVSGFRNMTDIIGEMSTAVYNRVEKLPMAGLDSLISQTQFNEEVGFDEDFQSTAVILPNTIVPKPYDLFYIYTDVTKAIYIVTNVSPVTVRSNPFTEITFRLFSRDPHNYEKLKKQVKTTYITTITAIGADKSLVIEKDSYFSIQHHVEQYLDLLRLYETLFYDRTRSAFIFDGLYNEKTETKQEFLDIILWKFMFDKGVIIYDDVVTYANNNYQDAVDRIYTSCPDIHVDNYTFRKSIIWRIFERNHTKQVDEFKYPISMEMDPRIGKYSGNNLIYFEKYSDTEDHSNLLYTLCPVWDEYFIHAIKTGELYPTDYVRVCDGCSYHCIDKHMFPINPYIRNIIISWYNYKQIDWDNLIIDDIKTSDNYFLIPLLLAIYKEYIHDLQK